MATPIPRELMTLDDWDALSEDNSAQFELQEGVLIASPKPASPHQDAMMLLAFQFHQQLPVEPRASWSRACRSRCGSTLPASSNPKLRSASRTCR